MSQYVLLRITTLDGIDINHFDWDRHNALYFFMLNADEHIYMHYGGRDSRSAMSYLNMESLELALSQGLEQHELYKAGKIEPKLKTGTPIYPRDIPSLKKSVIDKNRCVECHLVQDYAVTEKEANGTLDKLQDMYVHPDIRDLGIELDVPKGLRLAETSGAAKAAGILPGDVITSLNGNGTLTFADFQNRLNKVHRLSREIDLTVSRDGETHEMKVALPDQWWITDLSFRYWTIDPLVFFKAVPLNDAEKEELELPSEGFASRVTEVDINALLEDAHELEEGDIIVSVENVQKDELTQDVIIHIKLKHRAGNSITLGVLREGTLQEMTLKTKRQRFRKRD
ncbi:PDZ domain-containing protein [Puniceicoccaceae bacterium K14]|nr:PDZ domain-containing protein [Puniceicoccaceae bacterium K14]